MAHLLSLDSATIQVIMTTGDWVAVILAATGLVGAVFSLVSGARKSDMDSLRGMVETLQAQYREVKAENRDLRRRINRMTKRIEYLMGVIRVYSSQLRDAKITPCQEVEAWSIDDEDDEEDDGK
jgi:hypothetical protein